MRSILSALVSFTAAAPLLAQGLQFEEVHLPVPRGPSSFIAFGDLEGDGDADAFLGVLGTDRVIVGDGNGRFVEVEGAIPAEALRAMSVALGDVNGDGQTDLLVGNYEPANALLLNGGSAVFSDASASLPPHSGSTRVALLDDVDLDGDLDGLFLAWNSTNFLFRGDGAGSFTASPLAVPALPVKDAKLADVHGDGAPDLVVALDNLAPDKLYRNFGGAFHEAFGALPSYPESTGGVDLADVDSDTDLDVLFGNETGSSRVLLNNGAGMFQDLPGALPVPGPSVRSGDMDLDGDVDAFLDARLCRNEGAGTFTPSSTPVFVGGSFPATYLQDLGLADVDGDGDLDAYVVKPGLDYLQLNDGAGGLVLPEADFPAIHSSSIDVALGDVDGDGAPEALFAHTGIGNRLCLNDGTGSYRSMASGLQFPYSEDGTAALLADLDTDGDVDALLAHTSSLKLFRNGGTGWFVDASADLPEAGIGASDLAHGDVDGNGSEDLFIASGSADRLFLHAEDGLFADATQLLPPYFPATRDAELADVDGDGALDVITAKSTTGGTVGIQNRLFLGTSGGPFADVTATHLPALADKTQAVAVGDVDADGDLDVLFGNRKEQDRLLRNDGTGVLLESTADLPADADKTESVLLADFDEDGDLDAFTSNGLDERNRLLANDGAGHFTDESDALPGGLEFARGAAAGDIDLDGDLDLVLAISGEDGAYRNLLRQVACRDVVQLGQPYHIDVYGEPFAPWFLAWSPSAVSLPLAPFGLLQLNPASLVIDSSGFMGAAGVATRSFVAPSDPAWAGYTLQWQQLSGWPLLFSNRERMLLHDL